MIGVWNAVTSVGCITSWPGRFAVAAAFIFLEIAGSCAVRAGGRSAPVLADYGSSAPAIVTRAMWRAKPPLPGMSRQQPVGIILHHTGVESNPKIPLETKMRNLQSFSQRELHRVSGQTKKTWPDVPYHFYIDTAGRIAEGRDVRFAGDTNTNYNTSGFIQVVLEGDFEKETPTPNQLQSVGRLLVWLTLSWHLRIEDISVHKDHAPTTCPGYNFMAELPNVLSRVEVQRTSAIANICSRHPTPEFGALYCR
jgi:hypothetical protein